MIKIIIADDHPIVRAGMKQIIGEASDLMVVDEAGDGHKLLSKIRVENFDVVISDITMPHEALSDREYQVLCMLATGKTVTEIAVELALSAKTIRTYRSRILGKMDMKNNAELIHYAVRNKLVD